MFVTTGIYFGPQENEISHFPYFPHLFAGKPVDTSLLTKSIDKTDGSFLVAYSLWVWTKHDDMYPPLVSKRVVPLSKKSSVLPVHPSLPHSPPPVGRQPLIFLLSLVLHFSQCLIVASLWWLSGKESAYQCSRLRFDPWVGKIPLEKELATHSSILAWEVPWTESGGQQSMGLQKSHIRLSN